MDKRAPNRVKSRLSVDISKNAAFAGEKGERDREIEIGARAAWGDLDSHLLTLFPVSLSPSLYPLPFCRFLLFSFPFLQRRPSPR